LSINCVDLFCGAGGLTNGLRSEGIHVSAGFDVDEACRHPFEANNDGEFINGDVTKLSASELTRIFGDAEIRILAGCAPCQPFSTYSHRYETIGTPRWGLLYQFAKLVKGVRPEVVTMENVSSVTRHAVYEDFLKTLIKAGYDVDHHVIDSSKYGLPQSRKRTVLLASRLGPIEILPPSKRKPRTVRQAISKLHPLQAGEKSHKDSLHSSASLSSLNLDRIRVSEPGGTWRDWPEHLISPCHRKASGKTYPGVYARMSWDEPSPTLTTQFYGYFLKICRNG
jgi:DNA (cytosine-5)-methyltransferase 1